MKIEDYIHLTELLSQIEIEKVKLLTYYHSSNRNNQEEFTIADVTMWFKNLDLPEPNKHRLLSNIRNSKYFIKGRLNNSFKLHAKTRKEIDDLYKTSVTDQTSVVHEDSILPENLYANTRQYIESVSSQINSSYENNIFDGCAVLMRRLIEILLILSFKYQSIEEIIKFTDGNYFLLKAIISEAKKNNKLDLSRNSKKCLDKFRDLGNFSAHRLEYTCKPKLA